MTNRVRVPVSEVARELNRSPSTLKRWCREGAPHSRRESDGAFLVNAQELREWHVLRRERMRAARRQAVHETRAATEPDAKPEAGSGSAPASETERPEPQELPEKPQEERQSPPRKRPRRRAPVPHRPATPSSVLEDERPEPEQDPVLQALSRAVKFNRVLRAARSMTVTRVPTEEGDELAWGGEGLDPFLAISRKELLAAIDSGGLPVLLQRKYGPGTYRCEAVGPGGTPYPPSVVVVPDNRKKYLRLKADQEERRLREARERKEKAQEERRNKRLIQKAARAKRMREADRDASARWARGIEAAAASEAVARIRYHENLLINQINSVVSEHIQLQARQGRQARAVAAEVRRLRRQRDRLQQQRARLLQRQGRPPDPAQLEVAEEAAAEAPVTALSTPRDGIEPWTLKPLQDQLARVRAFDMVLLQERVLEYLEWRVEELFGAPPWDPRLQTALEHLLPAPPVGFVPWLGFRRPPAPPARFSGPPGQGWRSFPPPARAPWQRTPPHAARA